MKAFIFLTLSFSLLACSKNDGPDNSALSPVRTKLMAHVWFYDSVQILDPYRPGTYGNFDPKTELRFSTASWIYVYRPQFTSAFADTFDYDVKEPDTLFRWTPNTVRNENVKDAIERITDTSLVLSHLDAGVKHIDFYHAQ